MTMSRPQQPDCVDTATRASDYDAFAGLIREYVEWSRARYRGQAWFIERTFSHQSLQSELDDLSVTYGPPNGRTFLARRDGQVCGGGAYRRLGDGICEMKRLFVPDRFRGRGTGRRLCEAIIAAATDEGFRLMRLDTGDLLTEAIAMYKSLGFRSCAPYHQYPAELMPRFVFMEMRLDRGSVAAA
jgi:GNAT superfamily N-acetyltransferase